MRLLLIVDQFDRSTLCEPAWWMWDVAEHAAAHGHRVEAITLRANTPEADAPPGVQVHPHGPDGIESALVAALARHPDVIHLATPGPISARGRSPRVSYKARAVAFTGGSGSGRKRSVSTPNPI